MKIPKNEIDRHMLYAEVSEQCLRSRDDRVTDYVRRESYYLNGCESGSPPATFNKIYPSLQNLTAFIFAADSTSFMISAKVIGAGPGLSDVPLMGQPPRLADTKYPRSLAPSRSR